MWSTPFALSSRDTLYIIPLIHHSVFIHFLLWSPPHDVPSFPHQQVSILLDPVLGKLDFCTHICSLLIEVIPHLVSQNVPKLSFIIIN